MKTDIGVRSSAGENRPFARITLQSRTVLATFTATQPGNVELKLLSLDGRLVTRSVSATAAGAQSIRLVLAQTLSGTFVAVLGAPGVRASRTLHQMK